MIIKDIVVSYLKLCRPDVSANILYLGSSYSLFK